jgi:hypothetical protein
MSEEHGNPFIGKLNNDRVVAYRKLFATRIQEYNDSDSRGHIMRELREFLEERNESIRLEGSPLPPAPAKETLYDLRAHAPAFHPRKPTPATKHPSQGCACPEELAFVQRKGENHTRVDLDDGAVVVEGMFVNRGGWDEFLSKRCLNCVAFYRQCHEIALKAATIASNYSPSTTVWHDLFSLADGRLLSSPGLDLERPLEAIACHPQLARKGSSYNIDRIRLVGPRAAGLHRETNALVAFIEICLWVRIPARAHPLLEIATKDNSVGKFTTAAENYMCQVTLEPVDAWAFISFLGYLKAHTRTDASMQRKYDRFLYGLRVWNEVTEASIEHSAMPRGYRVPCASLWHNFPLRFQGYTVGCVYSQLMWNTDVVVRRSAQIAALSETQALGLLSVNDPQSNSGRFFSIMSKLDVDCRQEVYRAFGSTARHREEASSAVAYYLGGQGIDSVDPGFYGLEAAIPIPPLWAVPPWKWDNARADLFAEILSGTVMAGPLMEQLAGSFPHVHAGWRAAWVLAFFDHRYFAREAWSSMLPFYPESNPINQFFLPDTIDWNSLRDYQVYTLPDDQYVSLPVQCEMAGPPPTRAVEELRNKASLHKYKPRRMSRQPPLEMSSDEEELPYPDI